MIKKCLSLALLGATVLASQSCKTRKEVFKTTATGLEYRVVRDAPGDQRPAIGDHVEFHIRSYVHLATGDSVIFDSRKMNDNKPVPYEIMPPSFKGDVAEGFMMLTRGDSAVFRISVDSMIKAGSPVLPWMQKGRNQKLEYTVAVTSVKTKTQLQKEQQEAGGKQSGIDEELIKAYVGQKGIKAIRMPSGLYYKVDKMGAGRKPATGDSVSMNYTGMLLDGTKFDSNVDPQFGHVMPFWFSLSMGQVIKGWDEGIAMMPKGSKGTLYVPSALAYGSQSPSPLIPANSVMIFDVEVVDVRPGK